MQNDEMIEYEINRAEMSDFLGCIDKQERNYNKIEEEVRNDCRLDGIISKNYRKESNYGNPVWNFYDPQIRVKDCSEDRTENGLKIVKNRFLKPNIESQLGFIKRFITNFKRIRPDIPEREGVNNEDNNLSKVRKANIFEKIFSPSIHIHRLSDPQPSYLYNKLDNLEGNNFTDEESLEDLVRKCKTMRDKMIKNKHIALETLEKVLSSQIETFESEILGGLEERLSAIRNVDEAELKKKIDSEHIYFDNSNKSPFSKLIQECSDSFSVILSYLSTKDILCGIYLTCSYFCHFIRKKYPIDVEMSITQFNRFDVKMSLDNLNVRKFQIGHPNDFVLHPSNFVSRIGQYHIHKRGKLIKILESHCHELRDLRLFGISFISFSLPKGNFELEDPMEGLKRRTGLNEKCWAEMVPKCTHLESLSTEYFLPKFYSKSARITELKFLKRIECNLKFSFYSNGHEEYRRQIRSIRSLKRYFDSESRVHLTELILAQFSKRFFDKTHEIVIGVPFSLLKSLNNSISKSCPSLRSFQTRLFLGLPTCSSEYFDFLSRIHKFRILFFLNLDDEEGNGRRRRNRRNWGEIGDKQRNILSKHDNFYPDQSFENKLFGNFVAKGYDSGINWGVDNSKGWTDISTTTTAKEPQRKENLKKFKKKNWNRNNRKKKEISIEEEEEEEKEEEEGEEEGEENDNSNNTMDKIRVFRNFMQQNRSNILGEFVISSTIPLKKPPRKRKNRKKKNNKKRKIQFSRINHNEVWKKRMRKNKEENEKYYDNDDDHPDDNVILTKSEYFMYELMKNVPFCRYSCFIFDELFITRRNINIRRSESDDDELSTEEENEEEEEEERKKRSFSTTNLITYLENMRNEMIIPEGYYFVIFFTGQSKKSDFYYSNNNSIISQKLSSTIRNCLLLNRGNIKFLQFFMNYKTRGNFSIEKNVDQPEGEEEEEISNMPKLEQMLSDHMKICYAPQLILETVGKCNGHLEELKIQIHFERKCFVRVKDLRKLFLKDVLPFITGNKFNNNNCLKKFEFEVIVDEIFDYSSSSLVRVQDKKKKNDFFHSANNLMRKRNNNREETHSYFFEIHRENDVAEVESQMIQKFVDEISKVCREEILGKKNELNWEKVLVCFDVKSQLLGCSRRFSFKY